MNGKWRIILTAIIKITAPSLFYIYLFISIILELVRVLCSSYSSPYKLTTIDQNLMFVIHLHSFQSYRTNLIGFKSDRCKEFLQAIPIRKCIDKLSATWTSLCASLQRVSISLTSRMEMPTQDHINITTLCTVSCFCSVTRISLSPFSAVYVHVIISSSC
jgi:hypothetical protein